MGCWNENIFGGDNALDWRESIYSICGADEFDEKTMELKPMPIDVLESSMPKILEVLDDLDREEDDRNIGYIVLASIIMNSGAEFDELVKESVLSAIQNDDWAKENQVRKMVMRNYKKLISEYSPENPVNVENVNLLDDKEPTENEMLSEEFQQIYGILSARTKKLQRSITEESGVKEYDEGFKDAAEEEIAFLAEFKELFEKYEQFAALQERIDEGMSNGFAGLAGSNRGSTKTSSGGKDIMAG